MKVFQTPIKGVFLAIIISTLIYLALALVGGYISMNYKLVIGCGSYFIGTYFLLNSPRYPNKLFAFLLIFLFPFIAFIYFNLFHFEDTTVSFPSSLFICLGAACGYLFYKRRSYFIPVFLFLSVVIWFSFLQKPFFYKKWFNTYTGSVLFNYPAVKLYDTTAVVYNLDNPQKLYILDFWNSHCGVCFRKFPDVDSLNKLIDKSKFEIIAINIPFRSKEKKEDNYKILDDYNYGFKKLYTESMAIADSFGIESFPTTIVVKNQQIIFRGVFEDAIKRFKVVQ